MASAAAPEQKKGVLAKFAPFPKPFWVINGVELFERGAYYGMLSILSAFLAVDLNFPPWLLGILLAIQFPILYFLPVVSGAMADKLGFKRLLVTSFAFLIVGYLVLFLANDFVVGLAGIIVYSIGAGLFKPMPAATVSDTTSEQDRNFGFSIYYWMINLGAAVAPFAMGAAFGGSYRQYFLVSAALSALNLIICLTVWKDLRVRNSSVKLGATLARVGEIVKYPSFCALILIYSGFWFMYAITTSYMQIYALQQGILTTAQVFLLVPANAIAILVVGPVLSKLTGKFPSLPLMIVGITIFCSGFLLMGFVPFLWAMLAGIFVYSIGEFLTHPSYLAYVTKISPPERVPVFLGYGFIAIGIGQFTGTLAGGFLYQRFALDLGRPQLFWVAIVSVGLATVAALLVYNFILSGRRTATGPTPAPAPRSRFPVAPIAALLILLAIPALVFAGSAIPVEKAAGGSGAGDTLSAASLVAHKLADTTGTTKEKSNTTQVVKIPEGATGKATFTLTWKDEPASGSTTTNTPDKFQVHVTAPNGTMVGMSPVTANPQGGEGKIVVAIDGVTAGDYVVEIVLSDAGDEASAAPVPILFPAGTPVSPQQDTGNAWTLATEYQTAK